MEKIDFKRSCEEEKEYKVLSIDIGIHHLAFSYCIVNEDFTFGKIERVELIDISVFKHVKVSKKECKLYHDKNFCDWIEHVFQEYEEFELADYILIERQPPMGLVAIEQLIFSKYRTKSILIHPASVHSFFNMSDLIYEDRKIRSEEIASDYFDKENKSNFYKFLSFSRQHDVSDTILFLIFWLDKQHKDYLSKINVNKFKVRTFKCGQNINDWFDNFKYKPKV